MSLDLGICGSGLWLIALSTLLGGCGPGGVDGFGTAADSGTDTDFGDGNGDGDPPGDGDGDPPGDGDGDPSGDGDGDPTGDGDGDPSGDGDGDTTGDGDGDTTGDGDGDTTGDGDGDATGDGDGDTTGDGDGDTTGDGDGDTTGDGDGDGDGDEVGCFDDANELIPRVLRLHFGTAWIVDGGEEIQLELPPEGQLTRLEAGIRGEQVAIARNDKVNDVWSSEVFMYTIGDPAPLWSQPLAMRVHGVWISDDGTISGNAYWDSPGEAVGFIIHDGQAIEFPEFFPISPLVQDSIAVIRDLPGPEEELGWIDLALNWYPVEFPPIDTFYRRLDIDQHTHEYVADIDGTLTFIRAARDGIELMLPLPPEAENGDILAAGNYRLINDYLARVRIDVDLAEAVYVNPAPPPGWNFYQCGDVSINSDGALLYTLTDGVVAQMWGYDVDNDEWWAFGKPWGHIQAVMFFSKSDNLLAVVGIPLPEDLNSPCSAALESEPPPGALIGGVGQLLNSATGFQMDLDYQLKNWGHHMTFDSEERCVYLGLAQQTSLVRPVDDSDVEVDFGDNYLWYWLD